MDRLTNGIKEIQSYKNDIEKVYQKVEDQAPQDINFNDVSFDVRNSGRLSSYIGTNTSQVTGDQILKVISSGKEPDKIKKDVLKFLDSIRTSLAKTLSGYQSLAKQLGQTYKDDEDEQLTRYENDVSGFQQDLFHIYHDLSDAKDPKIQLGDLASQILDAGTKHNQVTKQMAQVTVSDINNLMQNHYKEYKKSYVMDYLLTMIGRIGFDAKDKGELNRELAPDSITSKAEQK